MEPSNAARKSPTWKPRSSSAEIALVSSSIRALMTNRNSPRVMTEIGSVTIRRIGRTNVLMSPKMNATSTSFHHSPVNSMFGTISTATYSAAALMRVWRMRSIGA